MEKNIFKNAYFGKAYKTRGGDKVILVTLLDNVAYLLIEENIGKTSLFGNHIHPYRLDGICTEYQGYALDIVSEWEKEINEEELDKLAEENNPYPSYDKSDMCISHYYDGFNDGFKTGYRKAYRN